MEKGLTTFEAQKRLQSFGKNEIAREEKTTSLSLFFSQFPNLINAILASASVLSFVIGNYIDGIFILTIILVNSAFGFLQEYRAEKSLQKLKDYVKPIARVIRNGTEVSLETWELVPGDLVILSQGDRIPADGKLIADKNMETDESILTGESGTVVKSRNDNIFLGTLIAKGRGMLLVEATGANTRFGKIAQTLSAVFSEKTPLQAKLDSLGKTLSLLVIIIAFSIIPIGIFQGEKFLPISILAISVGISAIPEGLPVIVTIALAIGVARMAKKKAIIRKMSSVETLGSIQILLIDKTGTLTENSQRVKKLYLHEKNYLTPLLKACVLGNTAGLIEKADNSFDIAGSKTDGALLLFAKEKTENIEKLKEGQVIEEYEFDPDTKTIATVFRENNKNCLFVRGAPENILKESKLTSDQKGKITKLFEDYAREGLRIVAFAKKENIHEAKERKNLEKDLEFLGFVGIYDPPRKEAKLAVEKARLAGIKTIMVTGDNELTALAIAKDVGLIEKDEDVATGEEIESMSDEELEKLVLKTRIFARNKPEDKLRLVTIFKKLGFVVGVTGDGVNDALALKKADVGIAMGEKGTDVAKEASDIVLTDDNFSTLVGAVEEGRTIYNNIIKSITYLITGNLSEIALIFFASLFGMPNPLLPTQILWINIVTDGLPALALASDNRDHKVLNLKPRSQNAPILSNHRLTFILIAGLLLAFSLLISFKILLAIYSPTLARTIIFNLLVVSHMALSFLVRGKSIFKINKLLIVGVAITLIFQVIITLHPFSQKILHLGL